MTRSTLRLSFLILPLVLPSILLAQGAAAKPADKAPAKAASSTAAAPPRAVAAEDAPKAVGPYSQAVVAGGFLFASGQLPIDPKSGDLVTGGIEQSADRVFDNLEAVLKADGLTFADVVKTTVYLVKAEDFPALNGVYARRMGESRPARATIIVAALPKGAPMEIELIARARK